MDLPTETVPWRTGSDADITGNEWAGPEDTAALQVRTTTGLSTTLESSLQRVTISSASGLPRAGLVSKVDDDTEQSIWGSSTNENGGSTLDQQVGATIERTINDNKKQMGISDVNLFSPYKLGDDQDQDPTSGVRHEQENDEDLNEWLVEFRKTYHPLTPDTVVVEEMPEREGLLFKHTNYLVKNLVDLPNTEPSKDRCVIRRYSDFVWLQEVLLKRYPFRLIPELPPKRLGSQNADVEFLERRRKGLTRFINLVMKHPVLSKDDLMLTFLTVPTDLSSWRKQANYDTTDEFTDKKISASFMKMWQKELSEQWNEADSSIDKSIEVWLKITFILERHERRIKQIAHERTILRSLIDDFVLVTPKLYPLEHGSTVLDINNEFSVVNRHLETTTDFIAQEAHASANSLVPKFKVFVDVLFSLKGLFERYRIMAGNNVPQLQRRVEINAERLQGMKGKPDVSGTEYDKIRSTIQRDKKSIVTELNRAWLIRECILQEFTIFQETQFIITRAFQSWSKLNAEFAGLKLNEWEKLTDSLMDMPLSSQ